MTGDKLKEILAAEVRKTNLSKTANRLGISTGHLRDVIDGARQIGGEMADKMGYERVVSYRLKKEVA